MRIINCLHPKRLIQNGSVMYVPCNKCVVCTNRRRAIWSKRLSEESRCHKHCFFVTLTYYDKFVPHFRKIYDKDGVFIHLMDFSDGLIIDFKNWFNEQLDQIIYSKSYAREKAYFDNFETFCHARFSDVQRLCKSLYSAQRSLCGYRDLRYFVAAELGPKTHRVHYHGLFWTDSDLFCEHFEDLLRYYWATFERSSGLKIHREALCASEFLNVQYSFGSCESYVAKYVAKFDSLPLVYDHPSLRPYFVSSRKPPIGCLRFEDFKSDESFFAPVVEYSSYKILDNVVTKSVLPSYLRNPLFQRCLSFERLSFSGRVSSYFSVYNVCQISSYGRLIGVPSFEEFCNDFINLCCRNSCDVIYSSFNKFKIRISPSCTNFYICLLVPDKDGFISFNQVRRMYYLSSRVQRFCEKYDLSFSDFVLDVESYYRRLDYVMLCNQLNFESEYVQSHPLSDLIFLFPEFLENVAKSSHTENYFLYRNLSLSQFGIDYESIWSKYEFITRIGHIQTPDHDYHREKVYMDIHGRDEVFDYSRYISDTFDYRDMITTNKKLYHDVTSSTLRNEARQFDSNSHLDIPIQYE